MIDQIRALESVSCQLEPSDSQQEDWHQLIHDYSNEFLSQLESTQAYQSASQSDENEEANFCFRVGEHPCTLSQTLEDIKLHIDRYGINPASAGHMGYIPGGGVYPAALGDYLAAVSNRYAGVFFASPGAVRLENDLLKWMCELMGFPSTSVGNLTSGGSIANLMAIVTAREAHQLKARDFDRCVIYLTEQTHHSVQKAIRVSGLSEAKIRYVEIDSQLRMSSGALDKAIRDDKRNGLKPFFVNASLGTTNTGAVDPINEIATVAQKHNLWFHVDAAYGGFFKLVESMADMFNGIEKADSITLDPHKTLFLPFGTGAILIKDKKALLNVHHYLADYMQDAINESVNEGGDYNRSISPADISPELTKHFRGMRLWLPLKLFGLTPFRAALEEKLCLARYFHQQIQQINGFEVGPEPELSVAIFRFIPNNGCANEFNQKLIKNIQKDGRIFLSSTLIADRFWIRVATVSFRSHLTHIEQLLSIIQCEVATLTETAEE